MMTFSSQSSKVMTLLAIITTHTISTFQVIIYPLSVVLCKFSRKKNLLGCNPLDCVTRGGPSPTL